MFQSVILTKNSKDSDDFFQRVDSEVADLRRGTEMTRYAGFVDDFLVIDFDLLKDEITETGESLDSISSNENYFGSSEKASKIMEIEKNKVSTS